MADDLLDRLAAGLPEGAGPLALLSGDEFLPPVAGFDRALIELTGPRVGLVLCADHRAAPKSKRYAAKHFGALGARIVVDDVHAAWDEGGRLPDFDLAYIGGGSPAALLECARVPGFWQELRSRWHHGMGVAGSSAGAMGLCDHMLRPRPGDRVPTEWSRGLGWIHGVAVAAHATSRPREWLEAVATKAPEPLLALDDHTGVILRHGEEPRVIGPGRVWLVGGPEDDEPGT